MDKQEIVKQTKLVFDFLQKLYLEVSYFIKEVEGLLEKEDEEFTIGRPGGYGITTNRSAGLETVNVELWPLRKMAVFFVPKESTQVKGGQTITSIDPKTKVIYLRIVLDGKNISQPLVYTGVLFDFKKKGKTFPEKMEHFMGHIEYHENRVFSNPKSIAYEDGYLSFRGELFTCHLYDLNSSEEIYKKVVVPALKLFRKLSEESQ